MARIKGPLFSLDASGPLGQLLTFGKARAGNTARRRAGPHQNATIAQATQREEYRAAVDAWNLLSSEEKAVWNTAAQGSRMTGYNLFIQTELLWQPPTDPYWSDVLIATHFDIDAADLKGHASALSNASISASQSVFGGKSLITSTTRGYATYSQDDTTDFDLTGDFTIEFWLRPVASGSNQWWFQTDNSPGIEIRRKSSTEWGFNKTGQGFICYSTDVPPNNTWSHIAATRQGSTVRIFRNGILRASGTDATSYTAATVMRVGTYFSTGGGAGAAIDDFRVTKGIARYTADFDLPTEPFPDA